MTSDSSSPQCSGRVDSCKKAQTSTIVLLSAIYLLFVAYGDELVQTNEGVKNKRDEPKYPGFLYTRKQ